MRPRLKAQYLEEMILDLRQVIKENTYDMAAVDIQAGVLAFSLKKLCEWLDENPMASEEEKSEMSEAIFRDASAVMQDINPIYRERNDFSIISDTREVYEEAAEDILSASFTRDYCKGLKFYREYYHRLETRPTVKAMELMAYLRNA